MPTFSPSMAPLPTVLGCTTGPGASWAPGPEGSERFFCIVRRMGGRSGDTQWSRNANESSRESSKHTSLTRRGRNRRRRGAGVCRIRLIFTTEPCLLALGGLTSVTPRLEAPSVAPVRALFFACPLCCCIDPCWDEAWDGSLSRVAVFGTAESQSRMMDVACAFAESAIVARAPDA